MKYGVGGKVNIGSHGIYLCTNDERFNGDRADNRHGYTYSWIMDSCISAVKINGVDLKPGLETPYRNMPVVIGNTYKSDVIVEKSDSNEDIINVGLHSFTTVEYCRQDIDNSKDIIVECVIPKDSVCYLGTFGSMGSYVSDTLTYVKVIQ